MKSDSDNFRESATIDLINKLRAHGIKILIYEPLLHEPEPAHVGCEVCKTIELLKSISDLILSNRVDAELDDVKEKVFSRDIFREN
jgi:UDPglucose 6-dehydrogenase